MKKRMIVIGILLVLILAMRTTVSAKVVRTPFTGVGGVPEILDPGKVFFSGDNVHVRGMVELFHTESDDRRYRIAHSNRE